MTGPRPGYVLTDEDRAAIRAEVLALPPLTDEQVDALADAMVEARLSRLRGKGAS